MRTLWLTQRFEVQSNHVFPYFPGKVLLPHLCESLQDTLESSIHRLFCGHHLSLLTGKYQVHLFTPHQFLPNFFHFVSQISLRDAPSDLNLLAHLGSRGRVSAFLRLPVLLPRLFRINDLHDGIGPIGNELYVVRFRVDRVEDGGEGGEGVEGTGYRVGEADGFEGYVVVD